MTGAVPSTRCSGLGLLSFDEGSDSVDHILDKGFLRESESSLVGDVEDTVVGLSMLSVDTSDLNVIFVSDLVEQFLVLHQFWQLDVHGGSEGGTEVGRARGDESKMVVVRELANLLNLSSSSAKSVEHFLDASSLLHGDDSELIFFVDPDQEGLLGVVENSSARWPVSVEVASLKESISLLEKEMVVDELL